MVGVRLGLRVGFWREDIRFDGGGGFFDGLESIKEFSWVPILQNNRQKTTLNSRY